MPILVVRKRADKEGSMRVPMTVNGEQRLVNPKTSGVDHEPWPLKGYEIEEAHQDVTVGMDWLRQQMVEGWVTGEGEEVTFEPGGPEENPWAITHTFTCWDTVTFHCLDGDVTYVVTRNAGRTDEGGIEWSVDLSLEEDSRG